jgi:2-polyprenyl-3-methyl-5-hydroxy-6-metoxy-1,4-benzoquinol methylase
LERAITTHLLNQKTVNLIAEYFSSVAPRYEALGRTWPWSSIRKHEARAVRRALGDIHGSNALDLGCGSGYYTRILLEMGARHVTAVDLSGAMLRNLPMTEVTPVQASADAFSSDITFDVICSAGLIEFIENPSSLLENARRLVSTNGRLVLLGPRRSILGAVYRRFHRHHNIKISLFTERELRRLAAETDWQPLHLDLAFPFSWIMTLEPST